VVHSKSDEIYMDEEALPLKPRNPLQRKNGTVLDHQERRKIELIDKDGQSLL
jgi:hypothetical protein